MGFWDAIRDFFTVASDVADITEGPCLNDLYEQRKICETMLNQQEIGSSRYVELTKELAGIDDQINKVKGVK